MKMWPYTMSDDPFRNDPYVILWRNVLLQIFRDLTYGTVKRGSLKKAYDEAQVYVEQPDATSLKDLCGCARVPYNSVVDAIRRRDYMRLGQTHLKLGKPSTIPGFLLRRDAWTGAAPSGTRHRLLVQAGICESNLYGRPHRRASARMKLAQLVGLSHDELWEALEPAEDPS